MAKDGKQKHRSRKTPPRTKRRTSPLLRHAPPNVPLPRQRQPTINHEKLEAYLAAVAKFTDALERDTAKLRKSRLKLDEIVHLLKSGADPASIVDLIESAVQESRATFAEGSKTVGDFKEESATDDDAPGPDR